MIVKKYNVNQNAEQQTSACCSPGGTASLEKDKRCPEQQTRDISTADVRTGAASNGKGKGYSATGQIMRLYGGLKPLI